MSGQMGKKTNGKRILFVGSRYVTYLYDKIAKKLIEDGHDVHWLILNHEFIPKNGNVTLLRYFKVKEYPIHQNTYIEKVIQTDRQLRFFNKTTDRHFYFYDNQIRHAIDQISPEIAFGEPTAFHHLIAIEICREKNILYLHPSTCRYPVNRMAFYEYDTLVPYKGSNDVLPEQEALETIDSIINRKSIPNYMIAPKNSIWDKVKDKAKIFKGFVMGERNNTPSPIIKIRKNRENKEALEQWNRLATDSIDKNKFSILFPLHMQPEASIDVWGREHSNQSEVIGEISKRLGPDEVLYIKPNPKSSFEMNQELINLVQNKENLKALPSTIGIAEVLDSMDLVINIVGTVAIECILANKPVVSLVETYFNTAKNARVLSRYDELKDIIHEVKSKAFGILDEQEMIEYINVLNARSYSGVISDPFNNRRSVEDSNITVLHRAFADILMD